MPAVNKATQSTFQKDVEFVDKQDEEQIASGIVMVPDKVDLQHDFVREETIAQFADQFEDFFEVGQADGGIMHAAWPSDWMELERNEVLEEATEIGGVEAPAGAWIQDWRFNADQLWELVADGILEGYSIGAVNVEWRGPFEQDDDEVDDVEIPDEIDDDEWVWELISGIVREVSTVDIPAVPDAMILETKSAYEKRLQDHLGNRDGFIEEAMQRGHTQAEAERLWDVLNAAIDTSGAGEPGTGSDSVLTRAGKAALSVLTGGDAGAKTHVVETPDEDPRSAAKEGRTLSTANRDDLKASIDAAVSILDDAGVDHGITRFTDREDDGFDLTEHTAREFDTADEEDEEDDPLDPTQAAPTDDAPAGDTADDTNMTDDNDGEGTKSLAEKNAEQIEELTETVRDLADAIADGGEEKTAQIEIGGDVYEVTRSEVEEWFEDGDADDPFDDAPAHIRALHEQVEQANSRIDTIVQQSGRSDQIDAAAQADETEGNGDALELDKVAEVLS